jgi:hypothetical protein
VSQTRIPAGPVIAAQRAARERRRLQQIHQVAASLHGSELVDRQSHPGKQETPSVSANEVSTDPRQVMADGMAARAKCDRDAP